MTETLVRNVANRRLTTRVGLYTKTYVYVTLVVMMMATALYARVSTRDKQEAANQLRQLRRYAKRQGWKIVGEYVDKESGAKADRPQFKRLFADASQGKFDIALFWSLDRFSREGVLKTLQHLQRLTDYGCKWKALTQEYLDSTGPFADAIVAIMAALAQQERAVIVERVKAGLERARAQGKQLGRPRKVFDRGKVRRLREKGHSYREIAAKVGISAMHAYRICRAGATAA